MGGTQFLREKVAVSAVESRHRFFRFNFLSEMELRERKPEQGGGRITSGS